MTTKPLTYIGALHDVIEQQRQVLEEIAQGNDWGGPDTDHISYMRGVADEVLEKGTTTCVIGSPDWREARKQKTNER